MLRRSSSKSPALPFPAAGPTTKSPYHTKHHVGRRRRRRSLLLLCSLLLALSLYLLWGYYDVSDFLAMLKYKIRNKAHDEAWMFVGSGCRRFRKKPLVFLRGHVDAADSDKMTVAVVWEATCPFQSDIALDGSIPTRAKVTRMSHRRFVHSVLLPVSTPGKHSITIVQKGKQRFSTVFDALLPTDETTNDITFHAAADNQFNVRTFRHLLVRLSKATPKPHFFLHAGDLAQNPDNAQQWQTDFWDPVSAHVPSTPLLLARGNHDWDPTGLSLLTGGPLHRVPLHTGTWYAYSPHPRCAIVILDSNLSLDSPEERAQQAWLESYVASETWKRSSIRLVVVHVPPFLEYWDADKWPAEHVWGSYVRTRLVPILMRANASLVISGHSHTYQRGFLDRSLVDEWSRTTWNAGSLSASLSPSSRASALRIMNSTSGSIRSNGTVFVVMGGAGGTLDSDRVEDWSVYSHSIVGRYHVAVVRMRFACTGTGTGTGTGIARADYEMGDIECTDGEEMLRDTIEWKTIGEDGKAIDGFTLSASSCSQ